jgi:hypothetical protein
MAGGLVLNMSENELQAASASANARKISFRAMVLPLSCATQVVRRPKSVGRRGRV